jgi:hypothetical protein
MATEPVRCGGKPGKPAFYDGDGHGHWCPGCPDCKPEPVCANCKRPLGEHDLVYAPGPLRYVCPTALWKEKRDDE